MPVEAVLTMLGFAVFIVVVILADGGVRAIAIIVFVCGVLASTSGIAAGIRDGVTYIVSR